MTGVEPATSGTTTRRSNQLSYIHRKAGTKLSLVGRVSTRRRLLRGLATVGASRVQRKPVLSETLCPGGLDG